LHRRRRRRRKRRRRRRRRRRKRRRRRRSWLGCAEYTQPERSRMKSWRNLTQARVDRQSSQYIAHMNTRKFLSDT
jgi:hypothetical protein